MCGRDPARTAATASRIGARIGGWQEAAAFGDATLLAIRAEGIPAVIDAVRGALHDQVLIDCTNPVVPGRFVISGPVAQRVAETTGARVVKAFNLCHEDVWRMTPPAFDGTPLAVPLCGDDEDALAIVRALVSDLGCTPVAGGGLERAALLEATAAFMIGLWFGGVDAQTVVPPLKYAFGVPVDGPAR